MIVEWYALKCMALGSFFTWFAVTKWYRLNKTRTFMIKEFSHGLGKNDNFWEALMAKKSAKAKGSVKKPAKKAK